MLFRSHSIPTHHQPLQSQQLPTITNLATTLTIIYDLPTQNNPIQSATIIHLPIVIPSNQPPSSTTQTPKTNETNPNIVIESLFGGGTHKTKSNSEPTCKDLDLHCNTFDRRYQIMPKSYLDHHQYHTSQEASL